MILDVQNDALLLTRIRKCELVWHIVQRERHGIGVVARSVEVEHRRGGLGVVDASHLFPVARAVRAVRAGDAVDDDLRGLSALGHEHRVLGTVRQLDGCALQHLTLVRNLQLRCAGTGIGLLQVAGDDHREAVGFIVLGTYHHIVVRAVVIRLRSHVTPSQQSRLRLTYRIVARTRAVVRFLLATNDAQDALSVEVGGVPLLTLARCGRHNLCERAGDGAAAQVKDLILCLVVGCILHLYLQRSRGADGRSAFQGDGVALLAVGQHAQRGRAVHLQRAVERQSASVHQGVASLKHTTRINGGGSSQRTRTCQGCTRADRDGSRTRVGTVDDERASGDVGRTAVDIAARQTPVAGALLLNRGLAQLSALCTVVNDTAEGLIGVGTANDPCTTAISRLHVKARQVGTGIARESAKIER